MDQAGNINGISVNIEPALNKPIQFSRTPKPKTVSAADLQNYVGEYIIANVSIKVYIKNGTSLYFFVPGQPEYELLPIGKDKFAIKALSGFEVQFIIDDKGEVTGLLSIQPNGTFKATKKK